MNEEHSGSSAESIRFSTYLRYTCVNQTTVSFNAVSEQLKIKAETDGAGPGLGLRVLDWFRLLFPYTRDMLVEQMKAVLPLVFYIAIFTVLVLHQSLSDPIVVSAGVAAIILGLMLFMEGLKRGLMPFGEAIGVTLPAKAKLPVVMLIAMLLGIGVTFAEPAIGALKTAGSIVDVEKAPYLYALLNEWSGTLVLVVGVGVGLATVLGTLRLLNGWSLKPLIFAALIPTLLLTVVCMLDANLSQVIGLAWDCGAVTTGPVTVPLVLALGIGMAEAAGKGKSPLAGFGIVTMASLFPILGVLLLALFVASNTTPEAIILAAQQLSAASASVEQSVWYQVTPGQEILGGMQAIVPLVVFLMIVMKFVIREDLSRLAIVMYGITLCVLGMIIFNLGLTFGLGKIGAMVGAMLPGAFALIDTIANSPLYSFTLGMTIALIFAWLLGFGATLAEPALNALGMTVENLTQGSFRKSMLMYAVSLGVGTGITLGVMKIAFDFPLAYMLIPLYLLALLLTLFSTEEYVNIAWDSAGVTTGPVTVPLVLAMGLGLGNAVDVVEGFGILSMASIAPIISVLTTGLWVSWKVKRRHKQVDEHTPKSKPMGEIQYEPT
ncbi:hypothetical protein MMIC_P1456 [Mariprofundus micogutta]|uniref:DUF1538 domain-containing protein n=1 Tax=Mariprofundus micogutta TaxID=1921010 RepID=A0A1L8CNR9_9PROT|nr:DUF1538 domain-containing protein [Mariprofundus micogutta]GAV20489.1 hypothetical protein MMIC_P1456 [Mariprofundus micogutta]